MTLEFAKHERIWLRKHPNFSEAWLHDRICDDTSMLGLGEVEVLDRERVQYGGGRLDMMLADLENDIRYEVEVMLGATDPSHIIRCIEYWDIERRRYPAYDHVAVLVAEEVTSRFLNVMALLAGSIPLVAIQLNALKVAEHVVLDFVKVLDQRALRVPDEPTNGGGKDTDRSDWESRVGATNLQICDRILEFANERADPILQLRYKKVRVGLAAAGSFFNVLVLWPKKSFVPFSVNISDAASWKQRLEEAGLNAGSKRSDRVLVRVTKSDLDEHEQLIRELVHQAVEEYQA